MFIHYFRSLTLPKWIFLIHKAVRNENKEKTQPSLMQVTLVEPPKSTFFFTCLTGFLASRRGGVLPNVILVESTKRRTNPDTSDSAGPTTSANSSKSTKRNNNLLPGTREGGGLLSPRKRGSESKYY